MTSHNQDTILQDTERAPTQLRLELGKERAVLPRGVSLLWKTLSSFPSGPAGERTGTGRRGGGGVRTDWM